MKTSEAFPGTFLKAADLGNVTPNVTIKEVRIEDVGDGQKPVLYFQGKDRGLVLNKTNANMIQELTDTDEMNDWAGHVIRLYTTHVDYQGQRVKAIRVAEATGPPSVPAPPPPPVSDDDDVPF